MGDYYSAFKCLVELIGRPLVPPPITKKTIELGFKHSPETVCIPFKYNLGNYIEALEAGADVICQAGGGCRFGYYAEVQEQILRRLGYEFEFFKLNNKNSVIGFIKDFKRIAPHNTYPGIIHRLALCLARIHCIDAVSDCVRKNIGFEIHPGQMEKTYREFLEKIARTYSLSAVFSLKNECRRQIGQIEIDKPADCLRVGVVGELYMLMEPFANFYLEKKLAQRKIEVHRFVTVSGILTEYFSGDRFVKKHLAAAHPYLTHHIGAHGTETVARANSLIKKGFDGIIHLKPFGCMPEVSAMAALNNLARDRRAPILYFSFDSQTSEAGLETRVEAFCDMLYMKQKKKKNGQQ